MYLLILYSVAYYLLKRRSWDIFTRIISTCNAINCVYMVCRNLFNMKIFDLYYVADEASLNTLYLFSTYLFIDGLFMLPDFSKTMPILLSLLHHFIGGLGIYLIAYNKMGFFLGFYFAMTEVSTPLLNLSWFFRNPILLKLFYTAFFCSRILTIPILLYYLNTNTESILTLNFINSRMSFYGSYLLISLNLTWFIFLTKKIIEERIERIAKSE